MAKTIQIRNVPDDVHAALRSRAAASGQSLSDFILERALRLAARPAIAEVLLREGRRPGGVASTQQVVDSVRDSRPG